MNARHAPRNGIVGCGILNPLVRYGMMYGMKRTTIYLPDDMKAALERTAKARGLTEAEVVRSAVATVTAQHAYPPPRVPLFQTGDPTLAERVDAELARGFGE